MSPPMDTVVLHSGGIDSTACIAYYISQGIRPCALFVDYGQKSSENERRAVSSVISHFGISMREVVFSLDTEYQSGFIPGRNGLLLWAAQMELGMSSGIVAIGVHAKSRYSDCSPEFIRHMQNSFDINSDGRVRIDAPFLYWSKQEIWTYCQSQSVPLELTYSCDLGLQQPCSQCSSCKDLENLIAG